MAPLFFCGVEDAHAEGKALEVYVVEASLLDDALHAFRLGNGVHRVGQIGIGGAVLREEFAEGGHHHFLVEPEELFHGERNWGTEVHYRQMPVFFHDAVHLLQAFVKVLEVP